MSFHHPSVLWLLALPVIWAYWQWTRAGHPLVLPFDHGSQREGRRLRVLVNLAETLPALLLAVAVLVLAGPRRPAPPENERILNNIIICLDVSGSMGASFGSYRQTGVRTRYDAAMEATREFCEYRKGDAFGLTIFGSEYLHWFPPTKELSAIRNALPFVRPDNMPPWFGGTLIAHALRGCKERLARTKEGDRAIILVTDGGSADFNNGGDRQIAEELAEHQIRVFTVLIGGDMFGVQGVYTIAGLTGGKVFQAGDPGTLETVFREIDQMQKTRFKQTTSDWVDYYLPLACIGLGAAGLWGMTLLGLRYTPW
jgi:Ca-activated chloride channel family protein